MNGKDLFLGMNYVKAKFIDEAETVTKLKEERKTIPFRKVMLIAAAIALLAITITACAYAIQRIRMNYVQHNVLVQTETVAVAVGETQVHVYNLLTDYYPQTLPEDYEILSGNPTTHNARGITYGNSDGKTIQFQISSVPREHDIALRPPVEESTLTLSCGEATFMKNEGAQVLLWNDENEGYDASLFTDDLAVDLISMAESMGYGEPIPLSVWYHRGQEWDPWYPQVLPDGYACTDVSPVNNGSQKLSYKSSGGHINFVISESDLAPEFITDEFHWEEIEVNGASAKLLRNQDTQRILYWENQEEGFFAFLETMDETIDLTALAESVGPGPKLEVSKAYLGPDYTIELEQEPTTYIEWQSVYPQEIPDDYSLQHVGDRAYGQQIIVWENAAGESISYTYYFRLGSYGREFEGSGEPHIVDINGNTGYLSGNKLIWADEELGFAYSLHASGDVDLLAIAKSVASGPELQVTDNSTEIAVEQLGDYRITKFPEKMIEDGLSGSPLEDEDDWYAYVRRWYYNTENNHQIYFNYDTYKVDPPKSEEDTLRLFVSGVNVPELVTIQGYPGIILQDEDRASVAWIVGDAAKGVVFQMTSEHFTAQQLLESAESVQKF